MKPTYSLACYGVTLQTLWRSELADKPSLQTAEGVENPDTVRNPEGTQDITVSNRIGYSEEIGTHN
jgi:hypothetical protein